MSNFLLTGAAGFIGAKVAEMLLREGHTIAGVDNLNNAYDVRVKHWRLKQLNEFPNFFFFPIDICDRAILDKQDFLSDHHAGNFEAVINLAARAGVRQSIENPWVYLDTNIDGTLNLLEFCRKFEIQKFILASSSSVYGPDAPLPTPEEAQSDYPLQVYAASKKSAETLCHAYHHLYGIDVSVLRYFTVYGPAGRPDMSMFRFTQWIFEGRKVILYGDGLQSRGFTYIDDIANGTILGLKKLGYEIINLGGHETIRMIDLIHILEELIGKEANIEQFPPHPADLFANWANIEKAKKLLGWSPKVQLSEGITKLVEWYKSERAWTSSIITD